MIHLFLPTLAFLAGFSIGLLIIQIATGRKLF